MYLFVRQDLSIAQQLVQACHGAHECGLQQSSSAPHSSIIVLGVPDKVALQCAFQKFSPLLPCHPFFEPYKDIGLTSFATAPTVRRELFAHYSLWSPKISQKGA